ncbi:hypothetical protein [Brevundimonas aurantiaca]|uniref:hypothetical protein n=1 Tax=Brevundimonas aurantiaca TaxID=74316 RepID=UPI001CD6D2FB|nr:hypothetical protein [Brevundimonas aurantiaca]
MTRTRALLIAAVLALVPATLVPATQVSAQSREASRDQDREAAQDRRGPPPRQPGHGRAPRRPGAVVRRVGAGREAGCWASARAATQWWCAGNILAAGWRIFASTPVRAA